MKGCDHKSAVGLLRYRVTKVPNRMHGRMVTHECLSCGLLPVTWPLGDASSNDKPRQVKDEMKLATALAATHELNDNPDCDLSTAVDLVAEHFARQPRGTR